MVKKLSRYDCPKKKSDGASGKIQQDNGLPNDVSGRYCKNNCSEYKNLICPKWQAKKIKEEVKQDD